MGSIPHGGCGPGGSSTPMSRAACSAGGGIWERSASWAGQTAGKTNRSADRVSTSPNRDTCFLVRTMTVTTQEDDRAHSAEKQQCRLPQSTNALRTEFLVGATAPVKSPGVGMGVTWYSLYSMVSTALPPRRVLLVLRFEAVSQKSVTLKYICSTLVPLIQNAGFTAGATSIRITAKSSASTQIRPR